MLHRTAVKAFTTVAGLTYIHIQTVCLESKVSWEPTCPRPRNAQRKTFVGCYSDSKDEKVEDEDLVECPSGFTYKHGFRNARHNLKTPISIYENVKGVLHQTKDSKGLKRPPEIETVIGDAEESGAKFAYRQVDSAKFLLPQRRNRVYGVVSENEQRVDSLQGDFDAVMQLLESHARWPIDLFLTDTRNGGAPPKLTDRVKQIVDTGLLECKGIKNLDLFLDSATSTGRKNKEIAHAMTTCLRPSHKVYSVTLNHLIAFFCENSWPLRRNEEL